MSEKYYNDQEEMTRTEKASGKRGINPGLVIFVFGLILTVIGGIICHNTDLDKYYDAVNYNNKFSASDVKNIHIDNTYSDVTIKKSSGNDIIIDATNVPEKFTAEIAGDTLTINSPKSKNTFISVPWFSEKESSVEISLPDKEYNELIYKSGVGDTRISDVRFDTVSLSSGTGDDDLISMECGELTIQKGVGDLRINDLSCVSCRIDAGTGDINAENFRCKKLLDADSGAGDIDFINAETGGIKFDTGTGDISFRGKINGNIDIDAGVGDIEMALKNPESDFGKNGKYTMTIDKGVGEKEITYNN